MRLLVAIGAVVFLAFLIMCGYLAYQWVESDETWIVRVPGNLDTNPQQVAVIRASLLNRSVRLMWLGEPRVTYEGGGAFAVRLSALEPTQQLIARVLSDPGVFSIRIPSQGASEPCAESVRAIVLPGSVEEARLGFNSEQAPMVLVRLTVPAGAALLEYSDQNVGSSMALCLNAQLLMAPTIQGAFGRYLQIEGLDSLEEATAIAAILNGGAIPAGTLATRDDGAQQAAVAEPQVR